MDAGFGQLWHNGTKPDFDMPDGPPAARDGPDAVDQLMAIYKAGLSTPPQREV